MDKKHNSTSSLNAWTNIYKQPEIRYDILYSSHPYDTVLSGWIKKFKEQEEKLKKLYPDALDAFSSDMIYTRLCDEIKPELLLTGLRSQDEFTTSASEVESPEKQFVAVHTSILKRELLSKDQEETVAWIRKCYEENPDGTKQLLQNVYHSFLTEEMLREDSIVNLLNLLREFDYEEMVPVGLVMLTSALSLNSGRIKRTVMDLFSHWPNRSTYNLLKKLTPPADFLSKKKYNSILQSFEERYGVPAEN